jgi:hypothetical protein
LSVPASVASGARITASGTAKRAPQRARVVLQRRSAGTWVGLRRSGLTRGRFTIRFTAPASAAATTLSVRALLFSGKRRLKASVTRRIAVRARIAISDPRPLDPPPRPEAVPNAGAGMAAAASAPSAPADIAVSTSAVQVMPGSRADVVAPQPLTSITALDAPTAAAPGVSASVSGGRLVVAASSQAAVGHTTLTIAGTGCTSSGCSRRFVLTLPVTVLGPGNVTWSDEFDGPVLDLTRWSYRATGPRFDAIVTPDAVSVGGGALTITTYTELGTHYVGMISTYKNGPVGFEQRYGYFEARVRFNNAPGQWSAFWLQSPTLGNPIGDPATAGVEMDIAEHRTRCVAAPAPTPPETCSPDNDISDRIQQAHIWDGYGPESKSAVRLSDPLPGLGNGSWHTWALRWTPTEVTFLYDGVATWTTTSPVSQRSEYIILSSDVGAFFAGAIPPAGYGARLTSATTTDFDYVRVWALE